MPKIGGRYHFGGPNDNLYWVPLCSRSYHIETLNEHEPMMSLAGEDASGQNYGST